MAVGDGRYAASRSYGTTTMGAAPVSSVYTSYSGVNRVKVPHTRAHAYTGRCIDGVCLQTDRQYQAKLAQYMSPSKVSTMHVCRLHV